MRIDYSQVVKAPREQVFQNFSDLETFPNFFNSFTRVTATERAGNKVTWEIDVRFRARIAKRTEKRVIMPAEQILVDGEMEGTTNRSVWKFEPITEGTRLTGTMEFQLKWWMKALRPIAKRPDSNHGPQIHGYLRETRGGVEYGSSGISSNGTMQGRILTDRQRQVSEEIASRT